MFGLILPLIILVCLASYLGGLGIDHGWQLHTYGPPITFMGYLISAALHLAWILPAARRCAAPLILVGWLLSLHFCRLGLSSLSTGPDPGVYALLAELVPLLLALELSQRSTWGERLARWRRARSEVSVQLRMGEGLLSWLLAVGRQLLVGPAAMAPLADYRRFVAELADAENRLQTRLRAMVLPEQVRQSIMSCASELAGQAEASAARTGFELEQSALAAAASCCEQLESLDHLSPGQRRELAGQCEVLFLELIEPARRILRPPARANSREEEEEYEPAH